MTFTSTDYDANIDYDAVIDFDGLYEALELLGGGPGSEREQYVYNPDAFRRRQDQLRHQSLEEKRAELKRIDDELTIAEQKKQALLAKSEEANRQEQAINEMMALEAVFQEEINRLRIERIWLMRLLDDDEAMLVILLRRPFH